MNLDDMKKLLDRNIYEPISNIDLNSKVYKIAIIFIIAYIVAHLIGIFKIHINYSI
jgi:hypothetical protein